MTQHFSIEENDNEITAIFRQDIGPEDSHSIKEEIRKRPQIERVIVDLTTILLITTPGLGALVAMHKFCREHNIRLVMCGLSPYVKEIFDLTKLSTIFEVVDSRKNASSL